MKSEVDKFLDTWLQRPEISARSVLVTILGDVIRPTANDIWLSQLFELCAPLGFSSRLIRTSLSRLAADGWVGNLREGRRSRYFLTELALRESASADSRIYSNDYPDWDGSWTILIIDRTRIDHKRLERLVQHLRWQGFTPVDRSVLIAPNVSGVQAREMVELIEPTSVAAIGSGRFDDVSGLTVHTAFNSPFNREALEKSYLEFHDRYRSFDVCSAAALDPSDAYVLRVALVHDLRRIVLASPTPPRELLPSPWAGDIAFGYAARLYPALSTASASWLSSVLDVNYPPRIVDRFVYEPQRH